MARVFHIWQAAGRGEWSAWRERMRGRLAEIIVLDQFSRNLWRGNALSFVQDGMALALSQEAQRQTGFAALTPVERQFLLMTMMHSGCIQNLWRYKTPLCLCSNSIVMTTPMALPCTIATSWPSLVAFPTTMKR